MILLDWTRMGKSFCLAGGVVGKDGLRIIRPLWAHHSNLPVRNVGWSSWIMEGRTRWEVFELVGLVEAEFGVTVLTLGRS